MTMKVMNVTFRKKRKEERKKKRRKEIKFQGDDTNVSVYTVCGT